MSEKNEAENALICVFEEDQLLFLPDECFFNIFKFVDFPSRANVRLVCKRFYDLICDLEKDKHHLELGHSHVSIHILVSILLIHKYQEVIVHYTFSSMMMKSLILSLHPSDSFVI